MLLLTGDSTSAVSLILSLLLWCKLRGEYLYILLCRCTCLLLLLWLRVIALVSNFLAHKILPM